MTSDDDNYDGFALTDLPVLITDDDIAHVTVTVTDADTTVGEYGTPATYMVDVPLDSEAAGNVTLTFAPDAQVTVTPASLTFTAYLLIRRDERARRGGAK